MIGRLEPIDYRGNSPRNEFKELDPTDQGVLHRALLLLAVDPWTDELLQARAAALAEEVAPIRG